MGLLLTCISEEGLPLFKEDVAVCFPLLPFGVYRFQQREGFFYLFSVEKISGYIWVKEWSFVVLVFQCTYNMHIAAASVRRKTWRRKCSTHLGGIPGARPCFYPNLFHHVVCTLGQPAPFDCFVTADRLADLFVRSKHNLHARTHVHTHAHTEGGSRGSVRLSFSPFLALLTVFNPAFNSDFSLILTLCG